ncbi:hypothetical protein MPER_00388 [Moniliophthora perniciosa FA553]|nr:hypothetical protein MPER_00388 [Moniliophthora perniciosa FA553]
MFCRVLLGISMAAPGGEDHGLDTDEFYEFLKLRGSGIITVPKDRWNAEAYLATQADHPGKIATTKGGYIPNFVRVAFYRSKLLNIS